MVRVADNNASLSHDLSSAIVTSGVERGSGTVAVTNCRSTGRVREKERERKRNIKRDRSTPTSVSALIPCITLTGVDDLGDSYGKGKYGPEARKKEFKREKKREKEKQRKKAHSKMYRVRCVAVFSGSTQ